jgi:hypothetical protein
MVMIQNIKVGFLINLMMGGANEFRILPEISLLLLNTSKYRIPGK